MFGGVFGNLIGILLGIAGFVEKNRKRVFSVLGLVLNTVIILGLCALIAIGLAMPA
jgi:hypothetical protein